MATNMFYLTRLDAKFEQNFIIVVLTDFGKIAILFIAASPKFVYNKMTKKYSDICPVFQI